MNYYGPRQVRGGGWHYTRRNDDRIWGAGYDSPVQSCRACTGTGCAACDQKGYIEVEPHPPHATAEEACECATQYVLDTARWDGSRIDTTHGVPRCEHPSCSVLVEDGAGASWGFGIKRLTVLCSEHRNRQSLAEVVGTVGEVISS